MSICDVLAERAQAYALGALEPAEEAEMELHLDRCPPCRVHVEAELAIAAALAPAQIAPPSRLRAAILAAARGHVAAASPLPWWRQLPPVPTRFASGAASLATLAFAATLLWALMLQSQVAKQSAPAPVAAVGQPRSFGVADEYNLARADMKRLVGSDTTPDARGGLYVDPATDSALLVAYKLPPLAPDRAYQFWLVQGTDRVSGGTFHVDAEGYGWLKVRAPRRMESFQRVGITVEPRADSDGPTGTRVLGGDL